MCRFLKACDIQTGMKQNIQVFKITLIDNSSKHCPKDKHKFWCDFIANP